MSFIMRLRLTLVVVLVLFMSRSYFVQAVDAAYFTVDNRSPLIGEPVQIVLHITVSSNAQIIIPDFAAEWPEISVMEVGGLNIISQLDDGTTEYTLPLTIALWQTGSITTSPLVIFYQVNGTSQISLQIDSIVFEVPSTLNNDDFSVRPFKPQISLPYFPSWILTSLLVLLVAVCVFWVVYRPRWFTQSSNRHKVLSDKGMLTIFNTLRQVSLTEANTTVVYQKVSDCLRRYVDLRLLFHSLDLTTNELLARLKVEDSLSEGQHRQLNDILRFADKVKFSQVTPDAQAAQQFALVAAEWIHAVEEKSEQLP